MKKSTITLAFLHCLLVTSFCQTQYNTFEFNNNMDILIEPGTDPLWQIGVPAKNIFNAASSEPNAILTDSLNTYPAGQSTWFEVELDGNTLWSWPQIQIEWDYKSDMEEGVDGGIIEASYDDGLTWKNVFSDPDFQPAVVGAYQKDTLANGQVGITGMADWSWMAVCWGSYNGTLPSISNTIKVRFTFFSDSIDTQQEGWMIDNIYAQAEIIGVANSMPTIPTISVFPNPTKDLLHFELGDLNLEETNIRVYNSTGQLVLSQKLGAMDQRSLSFSTHHFASGMYTVFIQSETDIYRASFVKMD